MNAPASFSISKPCQFDEPSILEPLAHFLGPSAMGRLAGEQQPNEIKLSCPVLASSFFLLIIAG
jgi:hypothetical protein